MFENGFEDEDVLWTKERETKGSAERRARNVLDRIFDADTDATCEWALTDSPMLPAT